MMAARAGAEHVYTVEANPLMADIAKACVARNGLADRVTVIAEHSTNLVIGQHLPRRADALVHEILSCTILTEGLVPSVTHAVSELLTPDALLLPERIEVLLALSEDVTATGVPWWEVEGFDLSPLARIDAAAHGVQGKTPRRRLSEEAHVADIDLRAPDVAHVHRVTGDLKANKAGRISGVEQWMRLIFPDGTTLSNDDPKSHWGTCYHPFAANRQIVPGEKVPLEIIRGPSRLSIGLGTEALADGTTWALGI